MYVQVKIDRIKRTCASGISPLGGMLSMTLPGANCQNEQAAIILPRNRARTGWMSQTWVLGLCPKPRFVKYDLVLPPKLLKEGTRKIGILGSPRG